VRHLPARVLQLPTRWPWRGEARAQGRWRIEGQDAKQEGIGNDMKEEEMKKMEFTPRSKTKMRKKTLELIKNSFAIDTPPTIHVEIAPFRDDLKAADGFTIIFTGASAKLRQKVVGEILDAVKCLLGEEEL
jgi:hypothetical protein